MSKSCHVIYSVFYSDASWDTLANQQIFIFKKKKLTLKKVTVPGDSCVQVSNGISLRSHKKTESGFPKSR